MPENFQMVEYGIIHPITDSGSNLQYITTLEFVDDNASVHLYCILEF